VTYDLRSNLSDCLRGTKGAWEGEPDQLDLCEIVADQRRSKWIIARNRLARTMAASGSTATGIDALVVSIRNPP